MEYTRKGRLEHVVKLLKTNAMGEKSKEAMEEAIHLTVTYNDGAPNQASDVRTFYSDVKIKLKLDATMKDPEWEDRVRAEVGPLLKSETDEKLFEEYVKLPFRALCTKQYKGGFPDSPEATAIWRSTKYIPLLPYLHDYRIPKTVFVAASSITRANRDERNETATTILTAKEVLRFYRRAKEVLKELDNPWDVTVSLELMSGRRRACLVNRDDAPIFTEVEGKPYQYHVDHVSKMGQTPMYLPCLLSAKYIVAGVEYIRSKKWPVKGKDEERLVTANGGESHQYQAAAKRVFDDERMTDYSVIKAVYVHLAWVDRERSQFMGPQCSRTSFYRAALGHEATETQAHYDRVLIVKDDAVRQRKLSKGVDVAPELKEAMDDDMEEGLQGVLGAIHSPPKRKTVKDLQPFAESVYAKGLGASPQSAQARPDNEDDDDDIVIVVKKRPRAEAPWTHDPKKRKVKALTIVVDL